jgi:AAHS family 4-hydroxybenzoate transporter-like MFS transporter
VFTLATPLADSYASLLTVRFLTGLGLGGVAPSFIALVSEYTPPRLRQTMIALLWAGFPLGGALGGLVGSRLIPTLGWEWLFWIGGTLPLIVAVVLMVFLPESLGFLVARGAPSERIAALLKRICGVTVAPGVRFTLGEERAATAHVSQLFANGRALGTALLWICFFIAFLQLVTNSTWTPILLARVGVPVTSSALALAGFNFGSVIGSSFCGWLLTRFGAKVVLPISLIGTTIAYGLIGHAAPDVSLIITLEFFVGLFLGCASTSLLPLSALYYPTPIRSTGIGWGMGMGRVGSFVGPLVVGALLNSGWTPGPIFVAIAAPALIAALSAVFIRKQAA